GSADAGLEAGRRPEKIGRALALEAGEGERPALTEDEIDSPAPSAGDLATLEDRLRGSRDGRARREPALRRAADRHLEDLVVVDVDQRHRADRTPVAEHGSALAELADLAEAMRDVEDRDPVRRRAPHLPEQPVGV